MSLDAKEEIIEVGEYRVNTVKAGRGDGRIVLLHGSNPGASWRDWEPVFQLAERRGLVIPDLIGYGKSSRPLETPSYVDQATVVHELMERLGVREASVAGVSWGGQVALETALRWPASVSSLVLISSAYDKAQIPRLHALNTPTLIVWALDDMITQSKGAYVLRDAISTSRLEMLDVVAENPRHDYTVSHKLQMYRSQAVMEKIESFLARPSEMLRKPPEMEHELKGIALRELEEERKKNAED